MSHEIPDDYVRMEKCMVCGKNSGAILMSRNLKSIPEEQAISGICDKCKPLIKNKIMFYCDSCGKTGWLSRTVFNKLFKASVRKDIKDRVRFEKCPACMGMIQDDGKKQRQGQEA